MGKGCQKSPKTKRVPGKSRKAQETTNRGQMLRHQTKIKLRSPQASSEMTTRIAEISYADPWLVTLETLKRHSRFKLTDWQIKKYSLDCTFTSYKNISFHRNRHPKLNQQCKHEIDKAIAPAGEHIKQMAK